MKQTIEKSFRGKALLPFDLGFRMQAEWEPHRATWLAWPHNEETWFGRLAQVEEIFLQMIEALAPEEKICLLVNDAPLRDRVDSLLRRRGIGTKNVTYHQVPTQDAWIRDYGPSFVIKSSASRKEAALVRWIFNAWGGKYPSLARDNRVFDDLEPVLGMPVFRPGIVLEGGSLDTNGKGTGLATEQCLLHPNRNPRLSRTQIEKVLRDFLGLTHLLWLGEGLEGDDTDGHVDDIARFVNPATVVTAVEKDASDPNRAVLEKNLKRLKKATDQDGKKLEIVTLPLPGRVSAGGKRLPASYLNFYIANGVVLVPTFGRPNDAVALEVLKEVFPKRRVIGIRSEDLVLGLGGIHCVTHEEPLVL